ncbi:MAG: hypothetical protein SAL07_00010 [Oscillatoria sp. PMC 1051.18]|nr:hypothetical protein [Oscillatoria sp. PMC 1050.18]MEC5028270.1 hypothetical protein [Oscillatoria sp. PMC 1051.18]
MIKHYVLSINPHAEYEWDRQSLRDPITGQRPDLATLIADEVDKIPGSYLVSVNLEVKVLEQAPTSPSPTLNQNLTLPAQPSEQRVKRKGKVAV